MLICQKVLQNDATKDQKRENAYWIGDIEKAWVVGSPCYKNYKPNRFPFGGST